MTGVFRTTPVETLHNLTRILPIPYVLNKLMHAHALHLQNLPANARVRTILSKDQCRYWPDYVQPTTLLTRVFNATYTHFPRVEGQVLMDLRQTPRFIHNPNPTTYQKTKYRHQLSTRKPPHLHIIISAMLRDNSHIATYQSTISLGSIRGCNRMQALS
jgi:hypothetical protein